MDTAYPVATPPPARHIHNLDALRAVAILLVMTFHARYLALGWVGVWVFFVISGFLITRSLMGLSRHRLATGLKVFYARRSLRIFPAYYLYVGVTGAALAAGLLPHMFWPQLELSLFYLYNLAPVLGVDGGRVYGHLWSLAVEEQYYLAIAPLVLLLSRQACLTLFAALVLLTPLVRLAASAALLGHFTSPEAGGIVQMLTPFQVDAFALGGLLALREDLVAALPGRVFGGLAAAVVAVVLAVFALNAVSLAGQHLYGVAPSPTDFSDIPAWRLSATSLGLGVGVTENYGQAWMYSGLDLLSFTTIACIIRYGQRVRIPVLNAIGRVSYGMYLYHALMVSAFDRVMARLAIPKQSLLGWACLLVLVALVYAVAWVSFTCLERPFLRLKGRLAVPAPVEA